MATSHQPTLRVTNPARKSRASSRKRVLHDGGQPPLGSVDSEIKRCAIEPRNLLVVSPRPCQTRGPRQATNPWPTQPAWSHRGRRTWRMITRVPRELGRPCRLHRNAGRRPGLPTPGGSTAPRPKPEGDEQRTQRWYRQAKETKRGEMGGRESQHLIVPSSRGNHPEGPRGGKEAPSHEPLEGNMRLPAIMPPKRGTYLGPLRAATPPPAEGRRCSSLTRRRGLWA